jgi:lipoate-protein ligase A
MFELLRVSQEKNRGRIIADVKERVTSLRDQGVSAGFEEAESCFIEGFRDALDLEFSESGETAYAGGPSPGEEKRARELAAGKFAGPEWLEKR